MGAVYPVLIIVLGSIFTFLLLHVRLYSNDIQVSPQNLHLKLKLNSTNIISGQ